MPILHNLNGLDKSTAIQHQKEEPFDAFAIFFQICFDRSLGGPGKGSCFDWNEGRC